MTKKLPSGPATPRGDTGVAASRASARERLLAAADELFYEGGVHSVGIDRIIEHAGVAKASLYDNFGSKDELISAYLAARHDARAARVEKAVARHQDPRDRVLAVFDALGETLADSRYRGCAFARAGAEQRPSDGVRTVCDTARDWMRDLFADLVRDAGAARPDALARQLQMLYDGAAVSGQHDRDPAIAKAARTAAALLLDAAIAARRNAR